jgi:hypothetical protein
MLEHPGSTGEDGGAIPTRSLHIKQIPVAQARAFIKMWHSRLPNCDGPFKIAFGAFDQGGYLMAAALWHNCSARNLPQDWTELRRMAVASMYAPPNTASIMIGQMVRWFKREGKATTLVSYQDLGEGAPNSVGFVKHTGTIYKATNWTPVAISRPRLRTRTVADQDWVKNGRKVYRRNDKNLTPEGTTDAIASAKVRWQYSLRGEKFTALTPEQIEAARRMKPTK